MKEKLKETVDSRNINQHKLHKTFFQRDMADGELNDFSRRTEADKVLHNKAFNIAKNKKYYDYQCGIASMFYKFFDKKPLEVLLKMRVCRISSKNYTNQLLQYLKNKK